VGASVTRRGYGFRQQPYSSSLTLSAGYGSIPGRFKGSLLLDRKTSNPSIDLQLSLLASGIEYQRYYGLGNDTRLVASDAVYKTPRTDYTAIAGVELNASPKLSFTVGPQIRVVNTNLGDASLFESVYGTGQFAEAGMAASARLDTRNSLLMPTSGVLLRASGAVYPELYDVKSTFGSARVEGSTYLTAGGPFPTTLALRGAAARVWGQHPFHEATFLGGPESLRGYREQRFGGDASLLGSAELRVKLADLFLVLPQEFGVLGLADAGRVYLDNESPGGWHSAVGGGVWFSIIDRTVLTSISIARSNERTGVYVKGGFAY
jgi:outer membrane protein assembly factor BamA